MIWPFLYFCLFSLKVAVFSDAAGGPALRLDDILAAVVLPALMWSAARAGMFHCSRRMTLLLLAFVAAGLLSTLWAADFRDADLMTALAYALRPLEYAGFAAAGFLIYARRQEGRLRWALRLYAIYFTGLCVAQWAGLNVGVSLFAFTRAAANTSGPYEAAAVGSFLFLYFISRKERAFAAVAVAGVLLTDSRITTMALLGAVLLLGYGRIQHGRRAARAVRDAIVVGVVGAVLILGLSSPTQLTVVQRYQNTELLSSWQAATAVTSGTPPASTPRQYDLYAYTNIKGTFATDVDASSAVRFSRWQIAVKSWASDPTAVMWGLGPSFTGAALDGYYVRLLVTQGILGVVLFALMLGEAWRLGGHVAGFRNYIIVLVLTAFFIDIFVSYRPMLLFWLSIGAAVAIRRAQPALVEARPDDHRVLVGRPAMMVVAE